jgi:hypothetical protein
MEKCNEVRTYDLSGMEAGVVYGDLFEHHGPRIHCRNGRVIQAADIIPDTGGNNLTVYVDVNEISATS